MMITRRRMLRINITTTNAWTQMQSENGNWIVDAASQYANVLGFGAMNLDTDAVTVEFAFSSNNTPADANRLTPALSLASNADLERYIGPRVARAGEGLWVRAVGTTPNLTAWATIEEQIKLN